MQTQAEQIDQAADVPVRGSERLVTLDFVRGVAVLGIFIVNVIGMAYPWLAATWPEAMGHPPDTGDSFLWLAQFLLVDGKMRGLFSLLFGAGMALFLERNWQRQIPVLVQARRLAWLALFGLAHFYLLWWGDILFLYAIAGFIVLAVSEWRAETQLRFGILLYVVGGAILALQYYPSSGLAAAQGDYASQWYLARAETENVAFSTGSYLAEFDYVVRERTAMLFSDPVYAVLETIPLMLIGMGLFRYGFFEGAFDPTKQRRWGWVGVLTSIALSLPLGWWITSTDFPLPLTQFVANGAGQVPRLPMILGLAALLVLLAPKAAGGWLGSRIVAAGRMAFSNYILCSLIGMLLFRTWAGGLWGTLDRIELLCVVVLTWALILLWSKPWLARFRYGPLEWLWRCLTYWKLFPLRR